MLFAYISTLCVSRPFLHLFCVQMWTRFYMNMCTIEIFTLKLCIYKCVAYTLHHSHAAHKRCVVINFHEPEASEGHLMHGGASSSLRVRAKKQKILVRSEQYANRSQMVQHRITVPSTHTCIWFANHSAHSCI